VGVVDGEVIHEDTRAGFPSVEEQIEVNGGSCGSEEKKLVPPAPLDNGEESFS
jgi:hypothetical protein